MYQEHLFVFLFSVFYPVNSGCSFVLPERQTASQVFFLGTLYKMHVHMLLSEAMHIEAEPQALLSMSGHMLGVLAW